MRKMKMRKDHLQVSLSGLGTTSAKEVRKIRNVA